MTSGVNVIFCRCDMFLVPFALRGHTFYISLDVGCVLVAFASIYHVKGYVF